ncbi:MAG: hypothetical protein ACYTG0_47315 [Planctomycetota bacterium]|jgi:hypothetical protein
MNPEEASGALRFEPPGPTNRQTWDYAVTEGFKFPDRFLHKCRELAQLRKQCGDLESKQSFVVRNLISIVDNCEDVLAAEEPKADQADTEPAQELSETAKKLCSSAEESREGKAKPPREEDRAVDAEAQEPTEEPTGHEAADRSAVDEAPASDPQGAAEVEMVVLASVHRSAVSLLAHLNVVRVDLMGKTYDNVTYEGRKIEDPFEVIESTQEGPARQLPVLEVVRSLWVKHTKEKIVVVRAGKVCC